MLHAIAEVKWAQRIAVNSDYPEVFVLSIVIIRGVTRGAQCPGRRIIGWRPKNPKWGVVG